MSDRVNHDGAKRISAEAEDLLQVLSELEQEDIDKSLHSGSLDTQLGSALKPPPPPPLPRFSKAQAVPQGNPALNDPEQSSSPIKQAEPAKSQPKSQLGAFILSFSLLLGVGIAISSVSQSPFSSPDLTGAKQNPDQDEQGLTSSPPSAESTTNAKATCGDGSGWLVLGPPAEELRILIRREYCADAFVNSENELQIARFASESDARALAAKLSQQVGSAIQVREARTPDPTANEPNASSKQASDVLQKSLPLDSDKPAEQSPSAREDRTCTIISYSASEGEGKPCSLQSRVNSNGNTVYDVKWPNGERSVYVFWSTGNVELLKVPGDNEPASGTFTVSASGLEIKQSEGTVIIIPNFTPKVN